MAGAWSQGILTSLVSQLWEEHGIIDSVHPEYRRELLTESKSNHSLRPESR